ncbi:MAG: hypothetical protein LBP62_00215 [Clostridiales bacterium]|jgi:multidrug transporter EmrE-like cation transporter|nr:hypothetical protein [Clostridiales bacterium]
MSDILPEGTSVPLFILGVFLTMAAGVSNFMGQILQKKAINDVKNDDKLSMKDVVKKPLWIIGLLMVVVLTMLFNMAAQNYVGPALIPGIFAVGLVALAIGSTKILGERLKTAEWIALAMVITAISMIALSGLVIEPDLNRFRDAGFVVRLSVSSAVLIALWLGLFYGGTKLKKHKAAVMSIGAGMAFALGNIWMFALANSAGAMFGGDFTWFNFAVFLVSGGVLGATQILGLVHVSKTLAAGNASLVVPMQQLPQQIMPVVTFFVIFSGTAPGIHSYFFMSAGIILITIAGFILGGRQGKLEKINADEPKESAIPKINEGLKERGSSGEIQPEKINAGEPKESGIPKIDENLKERGSSGEI